MIGIGEIVLSEPCGRDEALGVGDTPGDPGWTLTTLSFEVRFGESLAGKLRVFVHCDKLRTILTVHKHNTFTEPEMILSGVRSPRRLAYECDNDAINYSLCKLRRVRVSKFVCVDFVCVCRVDWYWFGSLLSPLRSFVYQRYGNLTASKCFCDNSAVLELFETFTSYMN